MPQVLAVADFEVEFRDYIAGQVIDFADADLIAHLRSRRVIDSRAAAVAAAIAGGAVPVVHAGTRPVPALQPVVVGDDGVLRNPSGDAVGGGGSTPVVNNLASTSTTSALSANQGRILKEGLDAKADAEPAPAAFTSRSLAAADDGGVFVCAAAQAATVPSGLPAAFGCSFKGAISVTAGAGVTVTDVRTTGAANPWCSLVQTATNTYDVVGGKA